MQKNEIFRKKLAGCVRIGIGAALAILFLVLCVLEMIPSEASGLATKEVFRVSSASLTPADAQEKHYTCLLMGCVDNPTDAEIRVEGLRVTVEGEGVEKVLELEGFVLPARTSREVSYSFEDTVCYDDVKALDALVGGETERISNRVGGALSIGGGLIVSLIGLVVSALFLVDSCKRFGYLKQELSAGSRVL